MKSFEEYMKRRVPEETQRTKEAEERERQRIESQTPLELREYKKAVDTIKRGRDNYPYPPQANPVEKKVAQEYIDSLARNSKQIRKLEKTRKREERQREYDEERSIRRSGEHRGS